MPVIFLKKKRALARRHYFSLRELSLGLNSIYCTTRWCDRAGEQHHMLSQALPPLEDDSFPGSLGSMIQDRDPRLEGTAALSLLSIIWISFSRHFNCAYAHS